MKMNQWKNEKKVAPWRKINEKMYILSNLLLLEVKITVSETELCNYFFFPWTLEVWLSLITDYKSVKFLLCCNYAKKIFLYKHTDV